VLRRSAGEARLIVSGWTAARAQRLDRWVLRSGDCRIVAGGPVEAERYRQAGLPGARIVQVPPGVPMPARRAEDDDAVRAALGLPAEVRLLAGVGPLEPARGLYDAVWALDILKYIYKNVHLVLVGRGSDRARLERFARSLDVTGQVHFVGVRPDVARILGLAEIVWVPARSAGGVNAALEAMAAGRPVVACRLPGLAEVIRDGETGFLHPAGDKAALARQTRQLLDDADLRERMGRAGRERAATCFSVEAMVRRYAELYAQP
jgi:glycosyltransferase involved in cell wall biosynthesis